MWRLDTLISIPFGPVLAMTLFWKISKLFCDVSLRFRCHSAVRVSGGGGGGDEGYVEDEGEDDDDERGHVEADGDVVRGRGQQVEEERLVEALQQVVEAPHDALDDAATTV